MTQNIILQGKKLDNTDGLSVASQQHIETPRSKGQEKHAEESMCKHRQKNEISICSDCTTPCSYRDMHERHG